MLQNNFVRSDSVFFDRFYGGIKLTIANQKAIRYKFNFVLLFE